MQHVYRTIIIIIIIIKNKICTASSSCTSICAFRLRAGFARGGRAGTAPVCLPALPVGPPRCPPGCRSVLYALLHLSKALAAAVIPLQGTKQCAFISFVKYSRNANHSDQNFPHQRSIKVTVKVKIASFPRRDLFGEKGGGGTGRRTVCGFV